MYALRFHIYGKHGGGNKASKSRNDKRVPAYQLYKYSCGAPQNSAYYHQKHCFCLFVHLSSSQNKYRIYSTTFSIRFPYKLSIIQTSVLRKAIINQFFFDKLSNNDTDMKMRTEKDAMITKHSNKLSIDFIPFFL